MKREQNLEVFDKLSPTEGHKLWLIPKLSEATSPYKKIIKNKN